MMRDLPLPKYHQVYLLLREALDEGRWADGLPSEPRLAQAYGVARVTVRRALESLAAEGLIERTPGRGTVPVRRGGDAEGTGESAERAPLEGLLETIVTMGLRTSVRVVELETVAAPEAVARMLALARDARVQKAVRVRATRDGPVSHITTWMPARPTLRFGRRELARKPMLVLLEEAGVRIGRATQTVGARLADAAVAAQLDVAVGSALLAVNRLVYDADGGPIQWLNGLYRPDRYRYEMELSRVGGLDARVWVSRESPAPSRAGPVHHAPGTDRALLEEPR
ncbi:MAG TPA: GntR family transcriptional regulator [Burkholderiaceae bacterium]|nr:GntR family transcriptional regulator [Burkholderiaceae bacterium]